MANYATPSKPGKKNPRSTSGSSSTRINPPSTGGGGSTNTPSKGGYTNPNKPGKGGYTNPNTTPAPAKPKTAKKMKSVATKRAKY